MSGQIKPCHICGSAAWIREVRDLPGPPLYQVRCQNGVCVSNYAWQNAGDAVEAWNRRPDDAEMLAVLRLAQQALNTAKRFKVPSVALDSYQIAIIVDNAISAAAGAKSPTSGP